MMEEDCRYCQGTGKKKRITAFVERETDCEVCKGTGTVEVED